MVSRLTTLESASVSSDRRAQEDSQFEGTGARTVAREGVRQLGSRLVVPTQDADSSPRSTAESGFSLRASDSNGKNDDFLLKRTLGRLSYSSGWSPGRAAGVGPSRAGSTSRAASSVPFGCAPHCWRPLMCGWGKSQRLRWRVDNPHDWQRLPIQFPMKRDVSPMRLLLANPFLPGCRPNDRRSPAA